MWVFVAVEQLPLSLHRTFKLMRELDTHAMCRFPRCILAILAHGIIGSVAVETSSCSARVHLEEKRDRAAAYGETTTDIRKRGGGRTLTL